MEKEGGNGERIRKWRKREEIKREWGNVESQSLSISSFSLHFLLISSFSLHFLAARLQGCNDSCSPAACHVLSSLSTFHCPLYQNHVRQQLVSKSSCLPDHHHHQHHFITHFILMMMIVITILLHQHPSPQSTKSPKQSFIYVLAQRTNIHFSILIGPKTDHFLV